MTTETHAIEGLQHDRFDVLLNDVLRMVANPELPERVQVNLRTRVWVRELPVPAKSVPAKSIPAKSILEKPSPVVIAPAVFLDFQRRMNPRRNARSTAAALLLHAAAIALVFWLTARHVRFATPATTDVTTLTSPPPMAPAKAAMDGGGGQRGPAPATRGQLPRFADTQITPPQAPPMEQPKIHMPDPTIEVQKDLKMADSNMPNLGLPNSPLLGGSMGNGSGSGLGAGNGAGLGPGSGGNYGGGLAHIGGGVSSPQLLFKVEPEFSEEARRAKFMGVVLVNIVVDQRGMPENVHVIRGAGMGLDEKAVEAVKQYKFKPAMENGKPVAVAMNVEVNFQIF